jgi:LmbE family N-acetylglucosaminyl deacetylase
MLKKSKNKNILVVVAHTDDETLGLGGTIARHSSMGDNVYGIAMTDGVSARNNRTNQKIKIRKKASISAGKIIGLKWIRGGSFADNGMDNVPLLKIIKVIENAKSKINPSLIYTHCSNDLNIDHRIVCEATLTAFRPQPNESWTEIRTFEVPSSTDYGHRSITGFFHPNLYVNISNTWDKKLKALTKYKMEMRDKPHSRSLEGLKNLAKYRGNQVGLQYAEAFEIIRKIQR